MATIAQINKFISELGPIAQKAYRDLGKVLPSVCIGMACVECGYGTAGSVKYHSYFGQKVGTGKTATRYWDGTFFTSKTSEEYTVGTHTVIKAAFRSYTSLEQATYNYYELLNTSLYKRVKAGADYKTQMQQIKACGYMTSSTEVNSVIAIIERYNLTKYDPVSVVVSHESNNPYLAPKGLLKNGSKGSGVKWLQYELNKQGFSLKIDGIFGPATESAVRQFQNQHQLICDGIVGPVTIAALIG